MSLSQTDPAEPTYPLRAAARLTGLSPELLRAWERRYGVVEPLRSSGGSRRYTASDLERLRLLKAAVDAGHRIGSVADLETDELQRCAEHVLSHDWTHLDAILEAVDRLASSEIRHLLALQMSALGPARFAREFAAPLVEDVGARWARGEISIAHEHLLSSHLRSLLGAAMLPSAASVLGPRIVFATPPDELHELGLMMAALTALGAGADPIYLGAQLPHEELVAVSGQVDATAVALSVVSLEHAAARHYVQSVRASLDPARQVFLGGAGSERLTDVDGIVCLPQFERFEQRITLLGLQRANRIPI